jgi:PhoH-like ATPase
MPDSESISVVTKLSPRTKLFVLDTNVLMHDPTSLFRFDEHDV